jgi:protocatechuate 3,4-dioxygenase beta subunit
MRFASFALTVGISGLATVLPAGTSPAAPTTPAAPVATATKPAPVESISGKVAGPDGKPIAAATVRAIPVAPRAESAGPGKQRADAPKTVLAKTEASGGFRLEGLGAGPFVVRVEAPGLAPAQAIDVPLGAALNLKLKPGVTVVGRVLDLTTQKPIAGATVTALEREASRFGREAAHTVKSGEDGTFQLTNCVPGIVVVEAIAPAKARARLDRVVAKALPPGEEPKFDANTLYLQPGGRIAGRVLGPDGKPLADALVTASGSEGSLFAVIREGRVTQRTSGDGRFEFDGVLAGNKYTVRAVKEGLASREEGPIPIEAGTDRGELELKLEAGASLAFRLVTAQDLPVKDVEARLQPQGGGKRRGFGLAANDVDHDKIVPQGDGKFLIKALDAGTFDVTLQPPDFADVAREGVKLKSGETTDLGTLRVKESKSISGRITDATGQPVAGASISGLWIDADARLSREARSGADGRYRLSGLSEQPIRNLSVRAAGYADASREGATPGDTAVDFTLEKTGSVAGRVQLRGGAVPAAFRVQAFAEAKEKQERPGFRMVITNRPDEDQIFTDPSGNFRVDGVEPGIVTVTAKADGKAPARKTGLKVVSDQVTEAGTIVLDDGRALRGRVVASKDDAPIPGATVSVSLPQGFMMGPGRDNSAVMAISGLDGRFEIAGLEARTYSVDASQPDYSPNTGRVEIGADADTDDFIIKLSRGGAITGLVRDAQKVPLTNVGVLLTKIPMGGGPQTVSTGPDGRYAFEKIAPGEYMVIRAPTGGGPLMLIGGMKQVVVREGETTTYDLDESAKISLTGRVLKGGQPVANAMLFFSAKDGGGMPSDLRQSRSDADGRYQVGLDAAGAYAVVVNAGGAFMGGGQMAVPVQVPDQPNPVVDITMKAAGIAGRVANLEGKPVSGAVVTVTQNGAAATGGHGRGIQDQSDPDGSFLVEGLEPGTYGITVAAAGYRSAEVPPVTIVNDNDVPSVDVRLTPGRTVRGRVVDVNGNGIAGAMVMTAPSGTLPAGRDAMPASSDVNGAFVVTAPADGPIDLTAVASGFPPARAVSVQPQDGVDVVLRAPRPGRMRVSVVDRSGVPVAGARVTYRAVPDYLGGGFLSFLDRTPPTGNDGATTLLALGPGGYELTVSLDARRETRAVTIAEGAELVETVTLP